MTAIENQGFYEDARLYDILHHKGTAAEVTGLESIADRFVGHESTDHWLEPACGSGRYLRVLAGRGKRVTGFDLEAGMIEYAKERLWSSGKGSRGDLFVADMADFAGKVSRPVDFAFNVINTIRHLESDDAMLGHLEQIASVLSPGGVYAVGISTCDYELEADSEDVWSGKRGLTRITQTVQYLAPDAADRAERVISNLAVNERGVKRFIDSAYTLRTYSRAEWLELIERSAMRVLAVVDEDGEDLEIPGFGYAIYVLGKRGGV